MSMTEDSAVIQKAKDRKVKRWIGVMLLIAIAYFVYSNFPISWPISGLVVHISGQQVQTCGPRTLTETYPEQLKVSETGFRVITAEHKAVIELVNTDDVPGEVRVIVYCIDGDSQGEQMRQIEPGMTEVFNFLDVADCDLEYYISPGMVYRQRNITVAAGDADCPGPG